MIAATFDSFDLTVFIWYFQLSLLSIFYASKKTESQVDMKKAKRMTLFNIMINISRNGIKAIMKNDPIKYLQKTRRKCGLRAHRQV